MILYIGERQDEAFVTEIGKGVTDEIRMVTNVHTIKELSETATAIPSTYLVINILCIRENPEELIKQLKYIQTQSNGNLIIIASGLMTNDPMIQSLYFAGIKNVITTSWFPTIAEQCIRYLNGVYQETELLEPEPELELESEGTTRLDLKQIYKDDPVILKQLEELEQQTAPLEMENQTVKLSPEELFQKDPKLAEQVHEYENEQQIDQSTTLYQEELPLRAEAAQQFNLSYQPQSLDGYGIPNTIPPNNSYNDSVPYGQSASPSPYSAYSQGSNQQKQPIKKKSRKTVLLTAGLCLILAISITVPVICTIVHNAKKDKEEQLSAEGNQYKAGSEIIEEETATPDQVVLGAIEEEAVTEEPVVVQEERTEEETAVTLTPIKEEQEEPLKTQESVVTPKPVVTLKPTKKPEETKKPEATKTPRPTKTPKPTKEPEKTKEPKATKTPKPKEIKVKSISLPDKVYVRKGGSYTINMSYSPSNATESISWSSSNTKIISVSNGVIKAKKCGQATITVRSKSGVKRSCKVVVSEE